MAEKDIVAYLMAAQAQKYVTLNETLFSTLAEARTKIAAWKEYYNRIRPHSFLDNLTPEEFAMKTKQEMQAA